MLLILQYSYLTAARCMCIAPDHNSSNSWFGLGGGSSNSLISSGCWWTGPSGPGGGDKPGGGGGSSSGCVWALGGNPAATRRMFELLGLHNTAGRVLPLFLIYLATLMYNYLLRNYQPMTAALLMGPTSRYVALGGGGWV